MKRVTAVEREKACGEANELVDGRFAVVHQLLVDMLTCWGNSETHEDHGRFFVTLYDAGDCFNPSCHDALNEAYMGTKNEYAAFELDSPEEADAFFVRCIVDGMKDSRKLLEELGITAS